jgi:flagellar basal-body rod modification protein FlgD
MATSAVTSTNSTTGTNPFGALNAVANGTANATDTAVADRFLKLLVTQMQNQDPLNPTDNAQVTSQLAQINTVNGIEKLNTTVEDLNAQLMQTQVLTGASLVGRDVTVAGNRLTVENGVGVAGYELSGTARDVSVEISNAAGHVVQTLNLGTRPAGRHDFDWKAAGVADGAEHRFRVIATNGTTAVPSTALMLDRVEAVSTSNKGLVIETRYSGQVSYDAVKAIN